MTSKIHRRPVRRCRCRTKPLPPRRVAGFWLAAFGFLLAWQNVGAQLAPAEDFFNGGAQFYISNNIPEALERVEMGLRTYPDDVKLKKLEELLKQKQQQQQQQQQQDQQDQQKPPPKKDQPNNSQGELQQTADQSKEKRPQPKPKEDGKNQDMPDPKQAEQKPANEKNAEKSDEKPPENQQAPALKAGEMKPEEAKRLLDAQKDGERLLQLKPPEKPRNSSRPVKDW